MATNIGQKIPNQTPFPDTDSPDRSSNSSPSKETDSGLEAHTTPGDSNAASADQTGKPRIHTTPDSDSRRPKKLLRVPTISKDSQQASPRATTTGGPSSPNTGNTPGARRDAIVESNGTTVTASSFQSPASHTNFGQGMHGSSVGRNDFQKLMFPELGDVAQSHRWPQSQPGNADNARKRQPATSPVPAIPLGDLIRHGAPAPQNPPPRTPLSTAPTPRAVATQAPPSSQDQSPATTATPPRNPSSSRPVLSTMPSLPLSPGADKSASARREDDDALTFRQILDFGPLEDDGIVSPRSGKSGDTIRRIARQIVAAELEDGLKPKTLGRLNFKKDGVSVYSELGSYANDALAKSELAGIVAKCRQRVLAKYGDAPERLLTVKGSASDATGEHTAPDAAILAPYLNPVFKFVCGTNQQFGDSKLPGTLLSLFKAIDKELVEVLLGRRMDQIAAEKLLPLKRRADNADNALNAADLAEARESLNDALKKLGWNSAYFNTLLTETVFSAAVIHQARANLFTGLLFTRCISPFIIGESEELQSASALRKASSQKALRALAACANTMFKNDYCEFVYDFIRSSHAVLPEKAALTLTLISRGEKSLAELKKSKPRAHVGEEKSGKSLRSRNLKRSSAPQLAQGDAFQKQMKMEKTLHEAETSAQQTVLSPSDRKLRIKAAADRFKTAYPQAFGDEEFSIAFHVKYKQWLKNNPLVQVSDVAPALEKIFREVKEELKGEAIRQERREARARAQQQGISASSSPASSSGSTTFSVAGNAPAKFSADQEVSLNKFFNRNDRKATLERYPHLRKEVEAKAAEWIKNNAGKNLVLGVKKIFETALIESLYQSYLRFEPAPDTTLDKFREAVALWKNANPDDSLTVENVGTILPGAVLVGRVEGKRNWAVRAGELQAEKLLQEPEVIVKFKGNAKLKSEFLRQVKQWLLNGAYSPVDANHVQHIYHEVVLAYYTQNSLLIGTSASDLAELREAAMDWCAENDRALLTGPVLDKLLGEIQDRRLEGQPDS
jgi:hypothetical protein